MVLKPILLGSITVLLAGCDSSSPTAPTTPPAPAAPTVTSVTVTGLDAIRTEFFSTFVATANMSNGTTQAATNATWSSDNTAVATVGASGEVSGIANGNATISATFNGVRGSKPVRIVANFGGDWSGTYRVAKCDESGGFRTLGWCSTVGVVGAVLPMSMSLSQSGPGRDQIGGTLALGAFGGNITGNVTGDGRLVLGGSFNINAGTAVIAFTIGGWETRLSSTTGMSGGWAHTLQATGLSGNAYQENTIVALAHLTAGASVPQRDVETFVPGLPGVYHMTLAEAAALMRQRPR